MIYAGIGSRETPQVILDAMRVFAFNISVWKGHRLRSGAAVGADTAFETGCDDARGIKQIFKPAKLLPPPWYEHAKLFHPAWRQCSEYAQACHARNSAIMLGENLDTPVDYVVCWTKDGKATGGTGQALRIADAMNIPIFNLKNDPISKLWEWLQ